MRARSLRRALVASASLVLALGVAVPASAADRVLHLDGTDVVDSGTGQRVLRIGGDATALDQSPNGARLAVGWGGGTVRDPAQLVLAGADGACQRALPVDLRGGLSWAPDSVRLALGLPEGVAVMDTGRPDLPVRPVPGAERGYGPAWAPSGDRIAFTRGDDGNNDVLAVPAAGGTPITLVGGPENDGSPAYAPDGRLAWIRRTGTRTAQLWVGRGDGTAARQVPVEGVPDPVEPRWTRDGRSILLTSDPFGTEAPGTFRVDVETGATTRLSSGRHSSPVDAPLGARPGYAVVAGDGASFGFGASCSAGASGRPVAVAAHPSRPGHWQVDAAGRVRSLGAATFQGDLAGHRLRQPIVGMAAVPDGGGYWLVARDGGVFAFGSARFLGSTGGQRLNRPIVGMAAAPDGGGYWLVAADGGIFSFGSARFHGSSGAMRLNQPIVGMHETDSGRGYWLVARDGGIFSFGDAAFAGSTGAIRLNQPIVGMGRQRGVPGYWLVAADGGIFSFGAHRYLGSTGGVRISGPAAGMVVESFGSG